MTRTGQVRLNHWRRPLRLRNPAIEQEVYSTLKSSECGGRYETPVENSTGSEGVSGWTEPMGSSVPVGTGDSSFRRRNPGADESGGVLCE